MAQSTAARSTQQAQGFAGPAGNGTVGPYWSSSGEAFSQQVSSSLESFLQSLQGRNASPATIRAYGTDLRRCLTYLTESNSLLSSLEEITPDDIHEYLASLGKQGRSGATRARKLASIREFFKFLGDTEVIDSSPAATIAIPKKEKRARVYLRVSNLQLAHLDLEARTLHIAQGKGHKDRIVELEKKGLQANTV